MLDEKQIRAYHTKRKEFVCPVCASDEEKADPGSEPWSRKTSFMTPVLSNASGAGKKSPRGFDKVWRGRRDSEGTLVILQMVPFGVLQPLLGP